MTMALSCAGIDELVAALEGLAGPVAEEAMRIGVRAGATVIADAMAGAAPVLDEKTARSNALAPGSLRADIRVVAEKTSGTRIGCLIGPGKKTQHVALWVEWGHRLVKGGYSKVLSNGHTRGRGRVIGEVEPHAFLRPSFEASAADALKACAEAALASLAPRRR